METIFLSSAGGWSNWVPFIVILASILVLVKAIAILIKFIDTKVAHQILEQISIPDIETSLEITEKQGLE